MKALPLWQPWASLVALEAKRVETRHWQPPTALLGQPIAIHATKGGLSQGAEQDLLRQRPFAQAFGIDTNQLSAEHLAERLPRGAIICTVVLARCAQITDAGAEVLARDQPSEFAFGDYTPGRFAWVLRNVQALPEPVPWKGSQGIFDVPDELVGRAPAQGALL